MDERERQHRLRARDNLPWYCAANLTIKLKAADAGGGALLGRLRLNAAQMQLHRACEAQAAATGMVRQVVLKGRQQGMSTYIEARGWHRITHKRGMRGVIISHSDDSAREIFDMVLRFADHSLPMFLPVISERSQTKLSFGSLDGRYQCLTAGSPDVGRSKTIHFLHGSEVAFWESASDILAGALQAVPDQAGSEVFLESTANGVEGEFHHLVMQAAKGVGPFRLTFIPWWLSPEYRARVPEGFRLSDSRDDVLEGDLTETAYAATYGLDDGQMLWRRNKIAALGREGRWKFKQEYPATVAEAFETSGEGALISVRDIVRARKNDGPGLGPLVIGFDPARFGRDAAALIRRRGRRLFGPQWLPKADAVTMASVLRGVILAENPEAVCVDASGGLGSAICDILWQTHGLRRIVHEVHFSGAPFFEPMKYANRRSEMWGMMRDCIESPGSTLPDDDTLHADLVAPKYRNVIHQGIEVLQLESKDAIKKRLGRSPDMGDAAALTFAVTVGHPGDADRGVSAVVRGDAVSGGSRGGAGSILGDFDGL